MHATLLKPSRKRQRPHAWTETRSSSLTLTALCHGLVWALTISLCASASAPAPETPAQALFNRVRQQVVASVKNSPRYTCVETVERRTFLPKRRDYAACRSPESGADLALDTWDRLRLDVGVVEGREVYSWHGEKQFHDTGLDELVGYGPIGSGMFSTFLAAIFGTARGHYLFTGAINQDGRRRGEFKFVMPQRVSDYQVHVARRRIITGYSGGFGVDWTNGNLLSLRTVTDELPRDTDLCSIEIRTNYRQVILGGSTFLLPGDVVTTMLQRDGGRQETQTKYQDCRTFSGEATIHFTDPAGASGAQAAQPSRVEDLPPGLSFRVRLGSTIDLKSNWVGDPVEGTLEQPLRRKKRVIAPKGARVEGRITRLLALELPDPCMELGIEWRRIVTGPVTYRVSARLVPDAGLTLPGQRVRISNQEMDHRYYVRVTRMNPFLDRRFVANWRSERVAEKH